MAGWNMKRKSTVPDSARGAALRAELRRDTAARRRGYREQALKILPHVCASCGREIPSCRLHELTVHHRDHDHSNNPPDGSNWELLCIYCHDHEHEKFRMAGHGTGARENDEPKPSTLFNPFAALELGGSQEDDAHENG